MNCASINLKNVNSACFWSKVNKTGPDDCWFWQAYCDKDGYGLFTVQQATRKAHRVAHLLFYGKLDPNLEVCHTCDNPGCVNPKHLWQGTNRENINDMLAKGRSLYGQKNSQAKLTPAKVRRILQLWKIGYLQKEIAKQIGCNQRTVSTIVTGKQWSQITGIKYAAKR